MTLTWGRVIASVEFRIRSRSGRWCLAGWSATRTLEAENLPESWKVNRLTSKIKKVLTISLIVNHRKLDYAACNDLLRRFTNLRHVEEKLPVVRFTTGDVIIDESILEVSRYKNVPLVGTSIFTHFTLNTVDCSADYFAICANSDCSLCSAVHLSANLQSNNEKISWFQM